MAGLVGAGVAVVGFLIYFFQDSLVYPSNIPLGARTTFVSPREVDWDVELEEVFFDTPDGERLQAYFVAQPQPDTVPTILFFHGNAGSAAPYSDPLPLPPSSLPSHFLSFVGR